MLEQNCADVIPAGVHHDVNSEDKKDRTTSKARVEGSYGRPLKTSASADEHQGDDHDPRQRSSAEATSSSKLKFDPLGGGSRKGKKGTDGGKQSGMEEELNKLMKELLGGSAESTGDVLRPTSSPSMKDTLDALKASGLGGDENSSGQGSTDEEDHLSSALVDSIMKQLLSKEILYQPMKEIGERYPPWLEEHKGSLDSDEYSKYTQQYEYIQKICEIYESDTDDFNGLMSLLQEMQECGQPPQEIIDELSPEDASSFASSLTGGSSPGGECVII